MENSNSHPPKVSFGKMTEDAYSQQRVFLGTEHIGWACYNVPNDDRLSFCLFSPRLFETSRRLGLWSDQKGSLTAESPEELRSLIRRIIKRG